MAIKRTYILMTSDGDVVRDELNDVREFKSEGAALKHSTELLQEMPSDEVWIFGLTHVLSRPAVDPVVEVVA